MMETQEFQNLTIISWEDGWQEGAGEIDRKDLAK